MYHTPTTAIVAGATLTPVVAELAGPAQPTTEVLGTTAVAGAEISPELVEVLGVKVARGDNPLVDAVHGVATGTLPLTGLNMLFLFLSAVTILLMGLALVRIGRNLTTAAA